MKNLKIKMLLLISAILVLMLSSTCFAWCIHDYVTKSVHTNVGLVTWEECKKCQNKPESKKKCDSSHVLYDYYAYSDLNEGTHSRQKHTKCKKDDYDEPVGKVVVQAHTWNKSSYIVNAYTHREEKKCLDCNYELKFENTSHTLPETAEYTNNTSKHWQSGKCVCGKKIDKYRLGSHDTKGTNGACSVCGYKQASIASTADKCPGSSSGSHMWESGYTYEKIDDKQHNKNMTCQMCGYKNSVKENHSIKNGECPCGYKVTTSTKCSNGHDWKSGFTYEKYNATYHFEIKTCKKCNYNDKSVFKKHTYENGECSACGYKQGSISFGNSAPAMCVGQSVSCYNLTNCSAKSGVTWTVIDDKQVVTRTGDAALLGKKAGTFKLSATKDGDTATCTITVFANHLVPGSYGSNETTHWISGKCSRCGASVSKGNPEKHTFPAGTPFLSTLTGHYQKGTCSVCNKSGRSEETKHTFIEAQLKYNETEHWYTGNCTVCGKYYSEFGKAAHEYGESGSKCKYCEYDDDRIHNYPTKIEFAKNLKKVLCFNSTESCSKFEFTCEPANVDTSSITYASSNTSVFSIMGGTLKCHSKGTANLIVTAVNGVHAEWKITVTDHEFKNGKCVYCSATESDENIVNPITGKTICSETKCPKLVDVPAGIKSEKITWASSNPSVLVVTSDGKATPTDKYCGQATVMAKVDGKTVASAIVNVHVIVGDPLYRYDRSSHYHKAVCKECKKELRIFGTEEAHIYVSGSTNCKECGYDRGTQSNVPTEIRFKRTAALLCVEHCNLEAKIECAMVAVPEILPDVAAKDSLTWTSSDNSIFAIENGYVVAKQKGKAVLTAKTSNGLTATCDIEVVDHETAIDMELNYNGKYHWRYGICGNSLGDIYNTDEIEHDFVKGVCKCGKKGGGENNPSHFVDIKKNDWYEESVDYVTEKGLMNGVGNDLFSPNSSMTRAMVVTVLYRMSGSDFTGKANFSDVGENEYYAVPVAWASENGIVTGYPDGTFAPNAEVTREQLVVILYRYANYLDKDTGKENHSNLESFSDFLDISDYSKDALSWGLDEGIISGTSKTTLAPKGNASRAQVATMLMRFDDKK